ncbi:hypothetical protein ACRALDRAFT_2042891 [Sodiomyces alcalophilus JCM 7366]|uniref:uncharacterized protein n=1 Tax=Sodiomyces alcalophilus JCM 7366 TaxID=591952 RepID=UPI0039B6E479
MSRQDSSARTSSFPVLQISNSELTAFHEKHFSAGAVCSFTKDFFAAGQTHDDHHQEDAALVDDDDDGLGYYEDGVKRTLTDEQIAMFRHSELQALRRDRERKQARLSEPSNPETEEDQGAATDYNAATAPRKVKKKHKKGRNKPSEPKPDLRKRTWDIVETGLDTLEYD